MESVVGFSAFSQCMMMPSPLLRPACKLRGRRRNWGNVGFLKAVVKVDGDDDDGCYLLQAAILRAAIRHQETLRPVPLFVDPYAACFLPQDSQADTDDERRHPHCLATKFIDERLVQATKNNEELKQVVLLTDGMDTRPYRIHWPASTLIFDVSPEPVYKIASQRLEAVGAKVPKSCLLLHIPLESGTLQQKLREKRFNGLRPSIWVLQGLPIQTLSLFEEILSDVDSLAMEGCLMLGELPGQLATTESDRKSWLEKILLRHGFRLLVAEVIDASSEEPLLPSYNNLLFVAEHMRLSDDQMELWRREFQRIEDDGDEEGFEEL